MKKITTLLILSCIMFSSVLAVAQDKKKDDNKPNQPQIQIYVQPINPGAEGPFFAPVGPGGNAFFPNLPLGIYDFGLFLDPVSLFSTFALPFPPPGGPQLPLPLPPLSQLTLQFQAMAIEPEKPKSTAGVETKDGKSDTDTGKGRAKAKVEQVIITVHNMPNSENQPFQVPIGQIRIDSDPKEGADKNKVTIGVKFPKPNKNNTR